MARLMHNHHTRNMTRLFAPLLMMSAGLAIAQIPEDLAAMYKYDRAAPLDIQMTETAARNGYRLFSISFALPHAARMAGFLVAPIGPGRKPRIVWMHSQGAIDFLGNTVLMAKAGAFLSWLARPMALKGAPLNWQGTN
jgi:hypothetical protein